MVSIFTQAQVKRKVLAIGGILFVLLFNAVLLNYCVERTWVPHDDGYFAHVADRLLDGEVLHADVQARHGAYSHFLNAAAMSLFGKNILSMRYPLVVVTLAQSLLVFALFLPFGAALAILSAITISVFSFVQFLNPSTHWYCLFFCLILIGLLRWSAPGTRRLLGLGFLLGLTFAFRQLTAIFVSIGLYAYLFAEGGEKEKPRKRILYHAVMALMVLVLVLYFTQTGGVTNFLFFGFWPLMLLVWVWRTKNTSDKKVIGIVKWTAAGFFLAIFPMVAYHWVHGSLAAWFEDTAARASGMLKLMPYASWSSFFLYMGGGLKQLFLAKDLTVKLNGVYWTLLPMAPFVSGLFVWSSIHRKTAVDRERWALPFMAVFYGLVSHTLQIPIYLYYTVGLSILGILWVGWCHKLRWRGMAFGLVVYCVILGVFSHAGQPALRGVKGILRGERSTLVDSPELPRIGVKILESEAEVYPRLISLIQEMTEAEDSIFVFPNNPEIYFLADRRNPFRFHLMPMAIQNRGDLKTFLNAFESKKPLLVIHNRKDKYNTGATKEILSAIQNKYELVEQIHEFDIYRLLAKTDRERSG